MISVRYHRDSEFLIVAPVDGRCGQLAPGALATADDQLNLGNLVNAARLVVGDQLTLISDEGDLSGATDAEAVASNEDPFTIEAIDGTEVTFSETFLAEPNSATDKFFEFKITRKSPHRKFTFRRSDQTVFAAAVLCVNGAVVAGVVANPAGSTVTVTWAGGVLTFNPIGDERWSCEMAITVDGNIEVVLDDGDVEFMLSNINVLQDAQLDFFQDDPRRFGSYVASSLGVLRRLGGERFLNLKPTGTDLELYSLEPNTAQAVAGTSNEILFTVRDRKTGFIPNLEGSLIFLEMRTYENGELEVYKEADWISTGLVRASLGAGESQAGSKHLALVVHRGGVPAKVQRTNQVLFRILAS